MWAALAPASAWLLPALLVAAVQGLELTEYGVLVVESPGPRSDNPTNSQLFCTFYYPQLYNISEDAASAPQYPLSLLVDVEQTDTCEGELEDVEGKFAFINGSSNLANCSIAERAARMQEAEAGGLVTDRVIKGRYNATEYNIKIPVFTLVGKDIKDVRERILEFNKSTGSYFYMYSTADEGRSFDNSLVVILLMAVGTVVVGSFWSGYAKQNLRIKKEQKRGEPREGQVQAQDEHGQEEELSVHVSPLLVIFFVFCMCSMLVLLYFFFNQLVYVIMTMFCIASSLAMYSCLEPMVMLSYRVSWLPVITLPRVNLYLCILQLELRQLFLLLASISTAATWFVFRKEDWSWMIQDFLGVMFSINMLKVLRLPSLKICTILLCALFFYDIFFVFITPLFMSGKSVMVEVATGHSSDEQLPMVLRVPHLSTSPSRICYMQTYSLLGFGDILVPGLLLSYAHSYDLLTGIKYKLYWLITCVAYVLGLIATFISLFLMNSAQPALLYLVPFTLIPTILVAWVRGDLAAMWEGDSFKDEEDGEVSEDESEDEDEGETKTAVVTDTTNSTDAAISTPDKNKLLGQ